MQGILQYIQAEFSNLRKQLKQNPKPLYIEKAKDTQIMAYEIRILHRIIQDHLQIPQNQIDMSELAHNNQLLSQNIRKLEKKLAEVQVQLNKFKQENTVLKDKLTKTTKTLEAIHRKAEILDQVGGKVKIDSLAKEVKNLQSSLDQTEARRREIASKVVNQDNTLKLYKKMNQQYQNTIAELRVQVEELQNQNKKRQDGSQNRNTQNIVVQSGTEEELKRLKVQVLGLRQNLKLANRALETLKEQHETAKEKWRKRQFELVQDLSKYQ